VALPCQTSFAPAHTYTFSDGLLRTLYTLTDELKDFVLDYLNSARQRMACLSN
jgi:hypothetical protein